MKTVIISSLLLFTCLSCKSQEPNPAAMKMVGGPCEGCEAIHEYGDKELTSSIILPGYDINEPKLHVTGTIYQNDGSPAGDVILYIYHTNREGIYEKLGNEKGWGKRHGYIRGWIKTGKDGKYEFRTFRPAAYPGRSEPEHIHLTVKEPGYNEYYINDIIFDNDPLLTAEKRSALKNRAGSGLVFPEVQDEIIKVTRDIYLGKNIPGYN